MCLVLSALKITYVQCSEIEVEKKIDEKIEQFINWIEKHPNKKRIKMAGEGEEDVPRDAKTVKSLLKSMGVEDYEPRVIHQFLELWYRYVVEVLTDAQVYSEHASKSNIDCDDVKLAIQSKVNFSFSQPPPREEQDPSAKSIAGPGVPLPPEHDTLLSPNYQLVIPKKSVSTEPEETEDDEEMTDPGQSSQEQQQQQQQASDLPSQTPQRVSFPLSRRPK
ncbi:unnamed protein product [Arabidopsis arenosa]|uniref:Transcription initiation factor TFIID subunit 9 n=1 Tax=Arabidopsis arenosa TaxID=38785 RepID=A0A8S2B5I7_ARAAE|nr:unnamed protein product [Arabidopsis arenosa]